LQHKNRMGLIPADFRCFCFPQIARIPADFMCFCIVPIAIGRRRGFLTVPIAIGRRSGFCFPQIARIPADFMCFCIVPIAIGRRRGFLTVPIPIAIRIGTQMPADLWFFTSRRLCEMIPLNHNNNALVPKMILAEFSYTTFTNPLDIL